METQLRIAVLCGGPFAGPALMKLAMEKFLCGIAIGSRDRQAVDAFRSECERAQLPFEQISYKDEVTLLDAWLDAVKPDAVFSICFPFRVPAETLARVPGRFFNFHPGPLPAYRGPSPIFEVLRRREKNSALSVHFMHEDYDAGEIIFEERIPLAHDETYVSLANKMSARCGLAAMNLAEMLQFGSRIPAMHQDAAAACFYPFPKNEDLTINWDTMDAESIIALIRAAGGWTRGAIARFGDEVLRISAVAAEPEITGHNLAPGTLIEADHEHGYCIACKDGKQIVTGTFSSDYGTLGADYYRAAGLAEGKILRV